MQNIDPRIEVLRTIRSLARRGNPKAPGGGRESLMKETLARYNALLQRCSELADLEQRIRQILG